MNVTINGREFAIPNDLSGLALLSMLPMIAGEPFRGYWLQRIMPTGIDEAVKDADTINDGDRFWAIPPCHW